MQFSSVILIDIGNTSTQTALERAGRFLLTKHFPSFPAKGRPVQMVRRLLRFYASHSKVDGAILCSVVPGLNKIWMDELKRIANGRVLQVNHKLDLGVKIDYPKPATIGADRLANAVAAHEKYGAPVIVADFGTALTLDFVGTDGAYEGGIIAPGPMAFAECLAEKTALLPRLNASCIRRAFDRKSKERLIGKKTSEAMLIGIRLGFLGLVKEIFARLARDPRYKNALLCATGGYAEMILSGAGLKVIIDPWLTLRGISRIYRLNS